MLRSCSCSAAGAAGSALGVFSTVDEHGLSLAEYMRKMRLAVTGATYQPSQMEDASELQMQHQELAAMMIAATSHRDAQSPTSPDSRRY